MRVTVLFFGMVKELAGTERRTLEMAAGASVMELVGVCAAQASKQSEVWTSLAVAVNQEYVSRATVLAEGDEVALLPPVSGGQCGGR